MMKILYSILNTIFLLFFISCRGNANTNKTTEVKKNPLQVQSTLSMSYDTIVVIDGVTFRVKNHSQCKYIVGDSIKEVNDFLNSNIRYFKADTIFEDRLYKEGYYESLLKGTNFLKFMPADFNKGNYTFSLSKKMIEGFGVIYIGKFYFPTGANSDQLGAFVMINPKRKEVSIWNFDNLIALKSKLRLDFNLRGNHSFYEMIYSKECKIFILSKH